MGKLIKKGVISSMNKNKKEIISKIVISIVLVCALLTMFLPYIGLGNKALVDTLKTDFIELEDISYDDFSEISDNKLLLIDPTSGIKALDDIKNESTDGRIKEINTLKIFLMTMVIVAWSLIFLALLMMILLKSRLKYILSGIFALLSNFSMCSIIFFTPDLMKNIILAFTDKEFAYIKLWVYALVEYLKDKKDYIIKDFLHDILIESMKYGYWMFLVLSFTAFLLCLIGFVVLCIGKTKKKTSAKLLGLRGTYEGADINVDDAIIIGRDPSVSQLVISKENISRKHCKIEFNETTQKYIVTDYSSNGTYILGGKRLDENVPTELEKGTMIELGRNGDAFRLS